MFSLKIPVLLAVATGALILSGCAAFAQTSYVMTCRAGGSMQAVAGQRVSNPHVFVSITYARAPQGASAAPPGPGECAWIDRAISPDEPNVILFDDAGVSWTQTICRAGDCWVNTPSSGATALMQQIKAGQSFQVHVYNDRAGHMVVTRVGP